MPTIAFVTYTGAPDLTAGDRRVVAPLRAHGITTVAAAWDDPAVDWRTFDGVILRSTWNYHHRPAAFAAWLDRLTAANVPVWNAPALVRWNMDKRYLHDLARQGVPVVPTVFVDGGAAIDLPALLATNGWQEAVIKPRVSASAYRTQTVTPQTAANFQAELADIAAQHGALIQPFMPQIRAGEWSLVYFGEHYSHAVIKTPAPDAIFVQEELGGTTRPATASADFIRQGWAAIIAAMTITGQTDPPLYTRVDAVVVAGQLTLMELELIEPALFLSDGAAARFADAIAGRLTTGG
jgi:hypothetical protein